MWIDQSSNKKSILGFVSDFLFLLPLVCYNLSFFLSEAISSFACAVYFQDD